LMVSPVEAPINRSISLEEIEKHPRMFPELSESFLIVTVSSWQICAIFASRSAPL